MSAPRLFTTFCGRRIALEWDGHHVLSAAGEVAKAVPIEVEYVAGDGATIHAYRWTGTPKAIAKSLKQEITLAGWLDVRVVKAPASLPVAPPHH